MNDSFLSLPTSSLKNIPAGAFRPLTSLEMLVLDNNLLSTLSRSALDGLGSLQVTGLVPCVRPVSCTRRRPADFVFALVCDSSAAEDASELIVLTPETGTLPEEQRAGAPAA